MEENKKSGFDAPAIGTVYPKGTSVRKNPDGTVELVPPERMGAAERQLVTEYIRKKYGAKPEYLWKRYPDYAVFRHADNNKWFALTAGVPASKLGIERDDFVDVINLKIDDLFFRDMLIQDEGIFPGYHMNKQHWISVLLDGTVSEQRLRDLIDMSFLATASAKKKEKI